ncbi:MAG: hypothetical protein KDJ82_00075 [Rhodobacteraceae bacterium]|jgi:hypothetical protein|nr:hypothetical protein [Paracoccaceae bacterium]
MNLTWLLRMAKLSRHPPSMRRVIIGAVAIGLALGIFGLEWLGLWPDWATLEPARRAPRLP